MTIIDDLSKPLPKVNNILLRRTVTIILGFLIFPIFFLCGIFSGLFEGCKWFWEDWIKGCW